MAASAPRQPPSRGHSRRAVRQCSAASADCASQREARRCSAAQAVRRGASSAAERLDCTSCRSASGIQAGGVSADRLSPGTGQKTANAGSCAARRNSSGPVSACASSSSARYVSRRAKLCSWRRLFSARAAGGEAPPQPGQNESRGAGRPRPAAFLQMGGYLQAAGRTCAAPTCATHFSFLSFSTPPPPRTAPRQCGGCSRRGSPAAPRPSAGRARTRTH